MMLETAHEENIPYQVEASGAGTGTDANAMQLNQAGMATGLISIPLRYMHTPCEVASLADIHNASKLIAGFIRRIESATDFTPSMDNLRPPKARVPLSSPAKETSEGNEES